jgi:CO dehydrogenase/acetyl-CoA synthase beta subunit
METETLKAPSVAHVERDLEKEGKLGKPRVYKLPSREEPFSGIEEIGVGPEYFSHIRRGEYHAEFGGPKTDYGGCIIIDVCEHPDEVEEATVKVYGPELYEIIPESTVPMAVHVKAWGEDLSFDRLEYLGRVLANAMMSAEGWTFLGALFEPWMRISKKVVQKYNGSEIQLYLWQIWTAL